MQIKSTTLSVTVSDVAASSKWLQRHFGFVERIGVEGFSYLHHPQSGADIAYLQKGIETLPARLRDQTVSGLIVAFVVPSLDAEDARLRAEGVEISLPVQEDPWGERLLQVTDPCGVVFQLVEWTANASAPQAI